jgi:hypothetical protein
MADDGLTPPPAPQPRPVTPQRAPDLASGTVKDSLTDILERSQQANQKWGNALKTSARQTGDPRFRPFTDSAPDPLKHVESLLDHAVGSDPSMAGFLKGMGSFFMTAIGHPIASATDEYQVAKIKALQDKFLQDHDYVLQALSEDLGHAKVNMRQLGNLLEQTHFDPSKLAQIMKQKSEAGDRTGYAIDDALKSSTDPQERKKLQALKDDLEKWKKERDDRIGKEKPDVDLLRDRLGKTNDLVWKQSQSMMDAANSPGPTTMTGRNPGEQVSHVIESTHTRPDAVLHVASLHNFLLRSRSLLTDGITPGK